MLQRIRIQPTESWNVGRTWNHHRVARQSMPRILRFAFPWLDCFHCPRILCMLIWFITASPTLHPLRGRLLRSTFRWTYLALIGIDSGCHHPGAADSLASPPSMIEVAWALAIGRGAITSSKARTSSECKAVKLVGKRTPYRHLLYLNWSPENAVGKSVFDHFDQHSDIYLNCERMYMMD